MREVREEARSRFQLRRVLTFLMFLLAVGILYSIEGVFLTWLFDKETAGFLVTMQAILLMMQIGRHSREDRGRI